MFQLRRNFKLGILSQILLTVKQQQSKSDVFGGLSNVFFLHRLNVESPENRNCRVRPLCSVPHEDYNQARPPAVRNLEDRSFSAVCQNGCNILQVWLQKFRSKSLIPANFCFSIKERLRLLSSKRLLPMTRTLQWRR